ncbi:hypothetical protein E2C01_080170 [Portunus trituberculatus]|uniref:Uncharacterized protein n=1 Tax=Portunus trituberculatus TaxID=210409 RepID=A0A5B7IXP9_PORTR|nr:hypothetical protein [Portunus trituberculatus]
MGHCWPREIPVTWGCLLSRGRLLCAVL